MALLLASFHNLLVFQVLFAVIQWCLDHYRLRWSGAAAVAKINNLLYAALSGAFCIWALWSLYSLGILSIMHLFLVIGPEDPYIHEGLESILHVYYLSKYWEALDLILVSLMGIPVNIHLRVHHNTTPLLAWVILREHPISGVVFMLCNTFMHFWIYLYFGGLQHRVVFLMVRIVGHLQLLVGMTCCVYVLLHCEEARMSEAVQLALYAVYFMLFRNEITDEAKEERRKKDVDSIEGEV